MEKTGAYRKTVKRYDVEGHAHFLTFSCFQRRRFLVRDRARQWFVDALNQARQRHPFDLWAFVIMPEHVHLLVLPQAGVLIRTILASIKHPVALRAVFWVQHNCPAFLSQMEKRHANAKPSYHFWHPGGGYDRNIWTAEELHEKIAYIHANPVRRGLVQQPEDWPWSSCRAWECDLDEPIRLDRESLPPLEN